MATTSTPVVFVRQARNMPYGIPAHHIRTFDDGTALVRFTEGNFLIVPVELLEPTTEAEAREYYNNVCGLSRGLRKRQRVGSVTSKGKLRFQHLQPSLSAVRSA